MRGTLLAHGVECAITGIIPAYAGNTFIPRSINIFSQDHPRICGEHCERTNASSLSTGSSPHMRGTHCKKSYYRGGKGIIPAYAGNTVAMWWRSARPWDHPRICGEHFQDFTAPSPSGGSSPHMRGTLIAVRDVACPIRIIPAYAGNTQSPRRTRIRWRDHPRICGEHRIPPYYLAQVEGSSPHMRGTPIGYVVQNTTGGIIPAYAGNTFCHASRSPKNRGSSPHMRGTRIVNPQVIHQFGIIPAYAGNTA